MKSPAVCFLLALLALPAAAAGVEPYLVKDINPVPRPADSFPRSFVTLGGAALFAADDGVSGRELWRSDGTAAGTWQVADLCAPDCSGNPTVFAETDRLYFFQASGPDFTVLLGATDGTPGGTFLLTAPPVQVRTLSAWLWVPAQGVLYFVAQDEHGPELWRSDGTPAGTHPVIDLRPGPEGSGVRSLALFKGRIYFNADDGRGPALWRTDGTASGTVRVKATGSLATLWNLGKRLVFVGAAPGRGFEPWASDGTAARTGPIADLVPGPGSPAYLDFAVHGGRLYFIADDGRRGQELWLTDGTAAGTRRLTDLPRKEAFFALAEGLLLYLPRVALGNRLVFLAHDGAHGVEPWVTDGTAKGTRLLRDLCAGACSGASSVGHASLPGLVVVDGDDGARGTEPWATDGTPNGTRLLADLCPGSCGSSPFVFAAAGGRLLFTAVDGSSGREIWATDGTAAGTVRVSDFAVERPWGDALDWTVAAGQIFFAAEDGEHGDEPWRADGTAGGTRLAADVNETDLGGSFPDRMRALGSQVVFTAYDGVSPGLWKSDGTAAGTVRFKTFGPDELDGLNAEGASAEVGGRLFYFAFDSESTRYVPWRTDGTEAGTFRLNGDGVPSCCTGQEMRAVGNTVFFGLRDEEHGSELWASDGTREGTRLILDIAPGESGSDPRELTAFQGRLWFVADGPSGRALWTSDGTAAGTVAVAAPGLPHAFALLTVHAGRLWFFADDAEHGLELWSSDGTGAGTKLAVDLEPGFGSFDARFMTSLGGRLVISGFAEGLWATDGTPAGTLKIDEREIEIFPRIQTLFAGRLYYVSGGVAWATDGTAAGTGPLLDRDGQEIPSPLIFAVLGDRLLFLADATPGTLALWESDGTPAGTFPIPGVAIPPFVPLNLVRAGDRVFLPAFDRDSGIELWAVRP
jgi:ELWxxDGT repeat protein